MEDLEFQARNIQFIEFELNNQCQYANVHDWCPRSKLGTEPLIELSTSAIKKVIKFFKHYDFTGTVYFSIYNEPTLDKRFTELCKYVKQKLNCKIQMYTNGIGLTAQKLAEYFDAGVDIARLSHYKIDYTQIVQEVRDLGYTNWIEIPDRTQSGWLGHDDRINVYLSKENPEINSPCYHPIQYYLVACNGDVMMCWDDWDKSTIFGNVYVTEIKDTLMHETRLDVIQKLKKGRYNLTPCENCLRPTEMCITEYRNKLKL